MRWVIGAQVATILLAALGVWMAAIVTATYAVVWAMDERTIEEWRDR